MKRNYKLLKLLFIWGVGLVALVYSDYLLWDVLLAGDTSLVAWGGCLFTAWATLMFCRSALKYIFSAK